MLSDFDQCKLFAEASIMKIIYKQSFTGNVDITVLKRVLYFARLLNYRCS